MTTNTKPMDLFVCSLPTILATPGASSIGVNEEVADLDPTPTSYHSLWIHCHTTRRKWSRLHSKLQRVAYIIRPILALMRLSLYSGWSTLNVANTRSDPSSRTSSHSWPEVDKVRLTASDDMIWYDTISDQLYKVLASWMDSRKSIKKVDSFYDVCHLIVVSISCVTRSQLSLMSPSYDSHTIVTIRFVSCSLFGGITR